MATDQPAHLIPPREDAPTEGVWLIPGGGRTEIRREGEIWRSYVYMFRHGTTPGGVVDFDSEEAVRAAIARIEAGGQHRVGDERPVSAAYVAAESQTMGTNMLGIGLILLGVLLLIVMVAALA